MDKLFLLLKGAAMGVAEVIPGVSGGTIAFISGIYETLLDSIKSFDIQFLNYIRKAKITAAYKHVNGPFLSLLLLGMIIGLVSGIFTIGVLLKLYPAPVWAFFFGLIVISAIYVSRQVKSWNWKTTTFLILGIVIAFSITVLNPGEGSANLIVVFLSGILAISALMLPGISGSFILLLIGMYTIIRGNAEMAIRSFDLSSFLVILFFGFGCLVGLASFSRLLSYTFKKYHDQTLAILTGFMIGSLNKIWPWRNVSELLNKETGEILNNKDAILQQFGEESFKILKEVNVLPADYYMNEPYTIICIASAMLGFMLVFLLTRKSKAV
jgi:putative membrane protein